MKRLTKQEMGRIRKAYHIGDDNHSRTVYVEELVAEVEACWRERKKDTSKLLHELRLLVGELDLAVYHILVRRAGYAVAYAAPVGVGERVGPLRINRYYPTLRKAVLGELKEMAEELRKKEDGR